MLRMKDHKNGIHDQILDTFHMGMIQDIIHCVKLILYCMISIHLG